MSERDGEVRSAKRRRSSSVRKELQVLQKPSAPSQVAAEATPAVVGSDTLISRSSGPAWNEPLLPDFQRVFSAEGNGNSSDVTDNDSDDFCGLLYDSDMPYASSDDEEKAARRADTDSKRAKVPMQPVEPGTVLPDPEQNKLMVELGTIDLTIKARAPYTVADLQERLVPTGVACDRSAECKNGTVIAISNIQGSEMLEVLPLPAREHGCELTPMRVRRITIVSQDGRSKPFTVGISVHKDAKFSDVLEAVRQHPAAACSPQEELVLGCCDGDDMENEPFARSFIVEDLSMGIAGSRALRGFVVFRVPRVKPTGTDHPRRVIVHSRRANPEEGGYPDEVDTAHSLLLPLSGDQWKGGHDADKQVAALVSAALAPYRKPDAPSRAFNRCFSLLRCRPDGDPIHGTRKKFLQLADGSYEVGKCTRDGMLHLMAHWKPAGLELYDTESWSQPEVDPSASQEIMDETKWLMDEEEKTINTKRKLAMSSRELIREIARACQAYRANVAKSMPTPLAACKLAILPEEGPTMGLATLKIQIFLWRKLTGSIPRDFFKAPDDWLEYSKNVWYDSSDTKLTHVMEHLMRSHRIAEAMSEELKACKKKMRRNRPYSVTTLMKWLEAGERPEAPQPAGLTVTLHPYQRQSLRFMLDNERGDGGHRRHFWVPYKTPSGFNFWWSPLFKRASKEVPPCPWGGFLAEEMGCGKTVEILALILTNPAPPEVVSGTLTPDGLFDSRATLVVCAVSLVGQWMEEARSKLNGSLYMYQYHGQGRNRDAKRLAVDYDLVVTTYQTLGSDWRTYTKKGGNTDGKFQPLGQIKWHRVVLDESHTIKAGGAQQAMACCALKADRRWCCSGTPISTDVSELLGQFKFLGCQPFDNKNFFQHYVKPAWGPGCYDSTGGGASLLYALGRTAIRHTKQQSLGGMTVCELPEKSEETIAVKFSESERSLYLRVHEEAKAEFQRYTLRGAHHVARNLLAIMSLLSPLRAICSGGILRDKDVKVPSLQEEQDLPIGVDPNLVAPADECSICLNLDMERPCRTPCLHWFCRECITAELTQRDRCPLCRHQIDVAQLVEGVATTRDTDEDMDEGPSDGAAPNIVACESKLRVLLDELAKMREADPAAKALIFTQFNSTLEWLMSRLTQEGYGYRTISGSMPLKKRTQAIEAFQRDPPTTVFLLSMRSGAVGINLTAANHVFILEPAMNPALEDQAIGRAFRMGQTRPVTVKKLYIKGSVEERIMELVKNRREGRATGGAGVWDEAAAEHRGRLRQQDVAGSISRDRQNLRLAELQLLFREPVLPITAGVQ